VKTGKTWKKGGPFLHHLKVSTLAPRRREVPVPLCYLIAIELLSSWLQCIYVAIAHRFCMSVLCIRFTNAKILPKIWKKNTKYGL